MHYRIDHEFDATVDEFEALLAHPELYSRLKTALPDLDKIELLEQRSDGDEVHSRVRYTPVVGDKIPTFGRPFVQASMLSWIEESTYNRRAHSFRFRIHPNIPDAWRPRFDSHGGYALTPTATGLHRRIDGEVRVQVALFGPRVERLLVAEVERSFGAEAQALARWLAERR
jgi:hypothetical protein